MYLVTFHLRLLSNLELQHLLICQTTENLQKKVEFWARKKQFEDVTLDSGNV